jgi:hypothetical protein
MFYVVLRQLGLDSDQHQKPLFGEEHRWDINAAEVARKVGNPQASLTGKEIVLRNLYCSVSILSLDWNGLRRPVEPSFQPAKQN